MASCRDPLKVIADLADALATGKELTPSQKRAMLLEADACSKFSNAANMGETMNREGASGLGIRMTPVQSGFMGSQQGPSVRGFEASQQTPSFTDMSHHSVGPVRLSRIPTIAERRERAISRAHLPAGSFKRTSDPRLMEERKKAADKEVLRKLILEEKRVMEEEFGSGDEDDVYTDSSDDDGIERRIPNMAELDKNVIEVKNLEEMMSKNKDSIVPTRSKMGGAVMSKSLSTPPGIINRVESDRRIDNLKMKKYLAGVAKRTGLENTFKLLRIPQSVAAKFLGGNLEEEDEDIRQYAGTPILRKLRYDFLLKTGKSLEYIPNHHTHQPNFNFRNGSIEQVIFNEINEEYKKIYERIERELEQKIKEEEEERKMRNNDAMINAGLLLAKIMENQERGINVSRQDALELQLKNTEDLQKTRKSSMVSSGSESTGNWWNISKDFNENSEGGSNRRRRSNRRSTRRSNRRTAKRSSRRSTRKKRSVRRRR